MVTRTPGLNQGRTSVRGVFQDDRSGSTRIKKLKFPVLKLEKVKKEREEHRKLLKTLFPNPVRLHRLIHDIEKNFAKEFASIIGSVDFAEQRLAGLLAALRELVEYVEVPNEVVIDDIRDRIRFDQRIHESFEDLVIECVQAHSSTNDL